MMRYRSLVYAAACTLLLAAPAVARAQSVGGTVRDESGRELAAVAVTLEGPTPGQVRTSATDQRGRWVVDRLSPGQYTLTLALDGFQPVVRHDVVVVPRTPVSLDVALQQAVDVQPGGTAPARARDNRETLATLPLARGLSTLLPAVPALSVQRPAR